MHAEEPLHTEDAEDSLLAEWPLHDNEPLRIKEPLRAADVGEPPHPDNVEERQYSAPLESITLSQWSPMELLHSHQQLLEPIKKNTSRKLAPACNHLGNAKTQLTQIR